MSRFNETDHSFDKHKHKLRQRKTLIFKALTNSHIKKNSIYLEMNNNYFYCYINTPFSNLRSLLIFIDNIDRRNIGQFFTEEDLRRLIGEHPNNLFSRLTDFDNEVGLNFVTPQEPLAFDRNRRQLILLLIDRLEDLLRGLSRVIPLARDTQDVRLSSFESMVQPLRDLSQWFRHNYDFSPVSWASSSPSSDGSPKPPTASGV